MGNMNMLRGQQIQDNVTRMTIIHYHNGDKYEGQIVRNVREGYGIYICNDKDKRYNYEYQGMWKSNLREGQGKCFYFNGDLYVGEWKQGKRHGKGEMFYRRGDRYQGEFKHDYKDGKGTLISQNGSKYIGKWRMDKKDGKGEMILQDGQVFEETWSTGILQQHVKKSQENSQNSSQLFNTQLNSSLKTLNLKEEQKSLAKSYKNFYKSLNESLNMKKFHTNMNQSSKLLQNNSKNQMSHHKKVALEKVERLNNIKSLLNENSDLPSWQNDLILKWLEITKLSSYVPIFKQHAVNGYEVLTLNENDLEDTYQIQSVGQRKNFIRQVNLLKQLWLDTVGVEDENGNGNLHSSGILQSSYEDSHELKLQSNNSQTLGSPLQQHTVSIYKNREIPKSKSSGKRMSLGQSLFRKSKQEFSLSGAVITNFEEGKQLNNSTKKSSDKDKVFSDFDEEDDEECLGQAGLLKSFKANGFNFYIDFDELTFDSKDDFIGGGGYGDVYLGKWLGTQVAIKRFGKRYLTKKAVKDFIKEIEVVNQLRHPNIVLYMGVTFDDNNYYYMVTEFVSKGSLFEILHQKKQQLDDDQVFKIAKQIALALQYLHKRKILHCDLKSQNILINQDWTVKICDFGLARYKEKFQKDNHGKIGTPHWMAPEILRGEKYQEAADVYSFGVILWEMLSGDIPYMGRSVAQITGTVGYHKEALTPPHKSNKSMKKIVKNCLLFDQEKRPTFEHILKYFEKLEKKPKFETNAPLLIKLQDFLS